MSNMTKRCFIVALTLGVFAFATVPARADKKVKTEQELIAALLQSTDKYEIIDGLKALRGLKAQSTIPEITPLLKNLDKNVIRDAIRTLAVLGDKSLVPTIQPFMDFPDLAVQKDAADALAVLKQK